MKTSWTQLCVTLTALFGLSHTTTGFAAETDPNVKVGVYAKHRNGKIIYNYRVINNTPNTIDAITIGRNSKNDDNPKNDAWELLELPVGWSPKLGIPSTSSNAPTGWRVSLSSPENGDAHGILWEIGNARTPALLGGQSLWKMSVTVEHPDIAYLNSHAMIHFAEQNQSAITVPIDQMDINPPTIEVQLTPDSLNLSIDQMVPINVNFSVKDDDYDPLPDIKLESITANEFIEPGDIDDASFGIDDRYFKLRSRSNDGRDRIYTVIYSATDATGNQVLASANVTVSPILDRNNATTTETK